MLLHLTDFVIACDLTHKLKCGKSSLPFLSDFHLLRASYKTMINMNQGDTKRRGLLAKGHIQQTQSAHFNGLPLNTAIE